ncbi:MAG: NfeD family protein [Pseudomonadota bacterium]
MDRPLKNTMKKASYWCLALGILLFGLQMAYAQNADTDKDENTAYHMEVKGPIGPAVTDYITRSLKAAAAIDAEVAIIEMHTPGGLVTSMQDIIQQILASPVPVVTYVSPPGSHAASAGTYILYGSHIAAMATATNLGAATPVQMGGGNTPSLPDPEQEDNADPDNTAEPSVTPSAMELKSVNDAVAYIRGLAELRDRNADWAELAVREAVSLSANEALQKNVIDIVATDMEDLLTQLDGQLVEIEGTERALQTADITLVDAKPDWRSKILMIITDPNIALLLMTIGFYGLIYEFANPGAMVPGIIGVICISIGLFGLNVLPVNYAGLFLLFLGISLMTAEAFVPSFGILGISGAVAFALGGTFLIDTDILGYGVAWQMIAFLTGLTALVMIVLLSMAIRAMTRKVVTGEESLIGDEAEIVEWSADKGEILVQSERWSAFSDKHMDLSPGNIVYVTEKKGLKLKISLDKPAQEEH